MNRRLILGLLFGAVLGVVCIIGAQVRTGFTQEGWYLFAFWYNRVILGLMIGVLAPIPLNKAIIRGIVLGTVISFAFYSATNFSDLIGFLAGVVYGVIIESAIYYFARRSESLSK